MTRARDAPIEPRIDDASAVTIDADTSPCRRYVCRMDDLGLPADFSLGSIERYRLEEMKRRRDVSFVDQDVASLRRNAVRLATGSLPKVYADSLLRIGVEEQLHGSIAPDLQALIRRAGNEKPQFVLSVANVKAEIASGPPVRCPEMTVARRRQIIKLLRYDLVGLDCRHDVWTMVDPVYLVPQLVLFLGEQPDDRFRRTWKAYLVFLESRNEAFAVSDDLFDAFRTWLRKRHWQELSISNVLKTLRASIQTAGHHDTFGPQRPRRYHDSETILTEPMVSALKELRSRLSRGEQFPKSLGPRSIRNILIDFCKVCREAGHDPQVTVVTVNAYQESLSRRKINANSAKMARRAFRLYCECSGTGTAWLRIDGYTHRHPMSNPILLPEPVRRKFNRFVRHAKLGRICFAEDRFRGLELLLGRLYRFCKMTGLPEDLSEMSISAYFASRNGLRKREGETSLQSLLRIFLQECDPRNPWILSGRAPQARTPERILDQKHWGRLRGRTLVALEQGIKPYALRSLDPILAYASAHQVVSPARILSLTGSSVMKLNAVVRALQVIDPRSALLFVIRSAIVLASRQRTNFDAQADWETRSYESLLAKCPPRLRAAIAPMTVPDLRGNRALPVHSVKMLSFMGRKLEAVAEKSGLEPFSAQAYTALIVELSASNLRAQSIVGYLAAMSKIAFLLELPPEAADEARRYQSRFRTRARTEGTLKDDRLRSHALTIEDMATAALTARQEALDPSLSEQSAENRRGAAAAIAIWTALPLRICDMQRLVVGVTLIRQDGVWHISLLTSKAYVMVDRVLPAGVTPHIDLLLMRGVHVLEDRDFQAAYVAQEGLPLFRNRRGAVLCHETFKAFLGRYVPATPHMIRTLVRDRMAIHGTSGNMISSYQLGHRSSVSGRYYETFADGLRAAEADRMVQTGSSDECGLDGLDVS